MKWHVICRVGKRDAYDPGLDADTPRFEIALENPGAPFRMRHNLEKVFGKDLRKYPGHRAQDFLNAAMAVLSADLYVPRTHAEDSWTRDVEVHLPVVEPTVWEAALPILQEALAFLSGDRWTFRIRKRARLKKKAKKKPAKKLPDAVCLFSGGLDSFVGAVDLLSEGRSLALVSHYGAGATHSFQEEAFAELEKELGHSARGFFCHVDPPDIDGIHREITRRARSFLFIGLAVAVASALGEGTPVYVCENGLISLNVPLTGPRSGSWSTRTTHPHFISLLRGALAKLGLEHPLILPYRFKTKGEMLQEAKNPKAIERITRMTMSCAHPESGRWEGTSPNTHCGYCFPCIIRRAATHAAGTTDAAYAYDVVTATFDATSKKARDQRAVRIAIERLRGQKASRALFDVLDSGPLEPSEARAYADVYRRGMDELAALLGGA